MRKKALFGFAEAAICLLFLVAAVGHAQIIGEVKADIGHPFIIGNATLPPGHYVFRMTGQTNQLAMSAERADGKAGVEFTVRNSTDSHTPRHTELVFKRYGSREFLKHIYESGDKVGVTVTEPSRMESRLIAQGQKGEEHTEEHPEQQ